MAFMNRSSPAAKTALVYITVGSIMEVWSGVWFFYLRAHPPQSDLVWYFGAGFALTGLVLLVIGLALGRIGRAARHADLPADDVVDQQKPASPAPPAAAIVPPTAVALPPPPPAPVPAGPPAAR
jgi:hypothetical protein